jgi:outer membrane protein OmpA-like peptidoglycan-associated protein
MNMRNFFLFFLFIIPFILNGQEYSSDNNRAIKAYETALNYYRSFQLDNAVLFLNKAIELDPEFIEAYLVMAQSYTEMQNDEGAINLYRKATRIDSLFYPNAFLMLSDLEFNNGLYKEALQHVNTYIRLGKMSDRLKMKAENIQKSAKFAIDALETPVPFNPENLGSNVNSAYDEYWPSLSADEQTLVFTVLLPKNPDEPLAFGNRQEDFFMSEKENGEWQPRYNPGGPLNTSDNEGAQTISVDGQLMIYTACNRADSKGGCDLYLAEMDGKEWEEPKNMQTPVNTMSKETQPSLSGDGKTLYYVSSRTGTRGGLDIWMSELSDNGKWTPPVNLGENINSPGNEQSPFIHPDNKTLYFSSDGRTGMGGFDIYMSRKSDSGTWSVPVNIGYPINTFRDEIGFIVNAKGNRAYFSSDRVEENGKDIYSFILYEEARPELVSYVKGTVYDAESYSRLKAKFELIDLETSNMVTESYSNKVTGEFLVSLPTDRNYALNVSRPGYLFYSENFSLEGYNQQSDPFIMDIPLSPIKTGEKVILKNIFFHFDSYKLKESSKAELEKIIQFMEENSGVKVEISGHTDSKGTEEYNKDLSRNRAREVYQYLVDKGIDKQRLTYKGYGEEEPIATNESEQGRARNRRTEFKIIETNK